MHCCNILLKQHCSTASCLNKNTFAFSKVDEDFLAGYHANYGIQYDFGDTEGTSKSTEQKQNEEDNEKNAKKAKLHGSKEHQGLL